jgi:hypothetical protein
MPVGFFIPHLGNGWFPEVRRFGGCLPDFVLKGGTVPMVHTHVKQHLHPFSHKSRF